MRKIIFFSKSMHIGGMEKALVLLLNTLCSYYDVTLILEDKQGPLLKQLNKKILVKEYKLSYNKNILFRKLYNICKRLTWSLFYKFKYDFSCCYATYSILCSKLALISSKNNALYVHSDYYEMYNKDKKQTISFFNKLNIDLFKTTIFVSNESKNKIAKLYPEHKEKFIVINNLVNSDNIIMLSNEKIEDEKIFNKNKINFMFVGRLDNTSKNLDLMIDAFSRALKKRKDIRLLIVGDGPDKEYLDKKIKSLGNSKDIYLIGERNNPYPYIRKSDCIILTSKYEGFPVIFLEAIVLRKSILSTIVVSDGIIDLNNIIVNLEMNIEDIVNKIKNFQKKEKIYNINLFKYNLVMLQKLQKIIEEV